MLRTQIPRVINSKPRKVSPTKAQIEQILKDEEIIEVGNKTAEEQAVSMEEIEKEIEKATKPQKKQSKKFYTKPDEEENEVKE